MQSGSYKLKETDVTSPFVSQSFSATIWLILRLWLGAAWLQAGWGKVFGDKASIWVGNEAGVAVTGFLKGALEQAAAPAWYADFIREVALPNATLFSYLSTTSLKLNTNSA